MAIYVVSHKVENLAAWKNVYDAFQPFVNEAGIKDHYVLSSVEDQNHVVVIGEGSADDLQKFLTSEELKSAMKDAGAPSVPDIYIGENQD